MTKNRLPAFEFTEKFANAPIDTRIATRNHEVYGYNVTATTPGIEFPIVKASKSGLEIKLEFADGSTKLVPGNTPVRISKSYDAPEGSFQVAAPATFDAQLVKPSVLAKAWIIEQINGHKGKKFPAAAAAARGLRKGPQYHTYRGVNVPVAPAQPEWIDDEAWQSYAVYDKETDRIFESNVSADDAWAKYQDAVDTRHRHERGAPFGAKAAGGGLRMDTGAKNRARGN